MAEALGVDMARISTRVFTLGSCSARRRGPRHPRGAAVNEMGIELIVEAFAVSSSRAGACGARVGAVIVGVLKAVAIAVFPEPRCGHLRHRIGVLLFRPAGSSAGDGVIRLGVLAAVLAAVAACRGCPRLLRHLMLPSSAIARRFSA